MYVPATPGTGAGYYVGEDGDGPGGTGGSSSVAASQVSSIFGTIEAFFLELNLNLEFL